MAQLLRFAGRARQDADYVPGLSQPNQPLPNHAGGAGKKYSHTIIVGILDQLNPVSCCDIQYEYLGPHLSGTTSSSCSVAKEIAIG